MEKLIQPLYTAIADFMPGYKTYLTIGLGMGMWYCQSKGYHVFDKATWGLVTGSGLTFFKMGMDRENKNHPVGTPTK